MQEMRHVLDHDLRSMLMLPVMATATVFYLRFGETADAEA